MAMNKQRRTSNINNIVTYDTLKNVTLPADLTIEGLTGAGFVKSDVNGLLSVDTGAYLPIPSQTGNSGKFLSTDGSVLSWQSVPQDINIYSNDGTLTSNRTVTLGGNTLSFTGDLSINTIRIGLGNNNIASNTVLGISSLGLVTTGSENTAVGYLSMTSITTGTQNTAIGVRAGRQNTGNYNTSVGVDAHASNTNKSYNTAVGFISLQNNNADMNTSVGAYSLTQNSTGGSNTAIGGYAGSSNQSGGQNIYVGYDANPNAGTNSNQIVIGNSARSLGSNTIVIGNSSTTFGRWWGRLLLGTSTDAGFGLDVNGTQRITSTLSFGSTVNLVLGTVIGGGQSQYLLSFNSAAGWAFAITNLAFTATYLDIRSDGRMSVGSAVDVVNVPTSAQFQISSTTRGFLPPRMTNTQRTAISTPATGLLAYSTDATEGLYLNLSGGWQRLLTSGDTTSNIYTADGTLTSNRTLTSGGYSLTFTGSNTASGAIARGLNLTHTLVAAANNDVLVGLDVNPTFTNGIYSNVTCIPLRLWQPLNQYGELRPYIHFKYSDTYDVLRVFMDASWRTNFKSSGASGSGFNFITNTAANALTIFSNGNIGINQSTDAGFRLDVNGTARVQSAATFNSTITATANGHRLGNLEILTSGSAGNTGSGICVTGIDNTLQLQGSSSDGLGECFKFSYYTGTTVTSAMNGGDKSFVRLYGGYKDGNLNNLSGNVLWLSPTYNFAGTRTGLIVRGFYYNPTLTSLTNTTHRAIETVSGDVVFGSTSGSVLVGTTTNAGYRLDVNGIGRFQNTITYSLGSTTQALTAVSDLTFGSGASITSGSFMGSSVSNGINTFNGDITVANSIIMSSQVLIQRVKFNSTGMTTTMTQGGVGVRALAAQIQVLQFTDDSTTGTLTHGAGMHILAPYKNSGNQITITNYYGIAINPSDEYSSQVAVTNRWGIYQVGSSDKNYFAGKVLVGTSTDPGLGVVHASGGLSTDAPTGGTAQKWKLGQYNATAPTATGYVEVEVNGTLYKLLAST